MDSWSHYCNRPTTAAEQILYNHLLDCIEVFEPAEVIDLFRDLFIDGTNYTNAEIYKALKSIVISPGADREFKFTLNRSCYIPVNRWLMQPKLHPYIPELVALFAASPTRMARSRTTKRLRELVRDFVDTEQYLALQRLAKVIAQSLEDRICSEKVLLGNLIHRYPCLYEYTLLTQDSTDEQRQRVRALRRQAQQQFEIDLSYYITHRHLRSALKIEAACDADRSDTGDASNSTKNPTLLSDRQLDRAIDCFTGRIDGANTHRDLAQQFLTYTKDTRCYQTFKQELYFYLVDAIDPKYGKRQFNQNLQHQLKTMLPQNDDQQMSDILLITTCRKLLNFLVVEGHQRLDHFVFSDLTANLGITETIGLLLKIVLLCGKVRFYLERKFSRLFSHYESYTRETVGWLVESLENLNVALSTNFGSVRLN